MKKLSESVIDKFSHKSFIVEALIIFVLIFLTFWVVVRVSYSGVLDANAEKERKLHEDQYRHNAAIQAPANRNDFKLDSAVFSIEQSSELQGSFVMALLEKNNESVKISHSFVDFLDEPELDPKKQTRPELKYLQSQRYQAEDPVKVEGSSRQPFWFMAE